MTSNEKYRQFKSLHGWFLETAAGYPDLPAVKTEKELVTYRELEMQSAAASATVKGLAAGESFVGVMTRRSPSALADILGILRAGKAYLPLNPRFPAVRNAYMLAKAGTTTIFAGDDALEEARDLIIAVDQPMKVILPASEDPGAWAGLFSRHSFHRLPSEIITSEDGSVNPEHPAYLMFTSGSTGMPKGVPVSHGNVHAYLSLITSKFPFGPGDRFSQTFDLTFDLSVHDLFVCWASGGLLCLPADNSSFGMMRYLKSMEPTVWFSVPSVASLMDRMRLLKPGSLPYLHHSFFCGEPLHENVAAAWSQAAPASRIINLYGPTEATIAVTMYELPAGRESWKQRHGIISIGQAFPGHLAKLSGDNGNELQLSGPQVVGGYLDEPEMTAASFVRDADSTVHYRTGDLAVQDDEGDLFFTGRADMEVKISGYRVNLSEVEHAINGMDWIADSVALFREGAGLAAVVIAKAGHEQDSAAILIRCRELLPWYMVPEKVIFVSDFPLNPNGKIDRNALSIKHLGDKEP